MTTEDRTRALALRADLAAVVAAGDTADERRARLGLVTALLLAKPIAGASAETGKARAESYLVALDDVPPWALAEVIRRWHRGECGEHDYRWAPDTATLRGLCVAATEAHRRAILDLTRLIEATTFEEAMARPQATAEERDRVIAGFAKLKTDLAGTKPADLQAAE